MASPSTPPAKDGRHPSDDFVLVLIDGSADSYIFRDELISSSGGRDAAFELCKKAKEYLEKDQLPDKVCPPVSVQVYAHANLAYRLCETGVIGSPNRFFNFGAAFSGALDRTDFVYVGNRRNRSCLQGKVRAAFSQAIANPNCRNILFGGVHDGRYAKLLTNLDADQLGRVSLIYGINRNINLGGLPVRYVQLGGIFRTKPLPRAPGARNRSEKESSDGSHASPAIRALHEKSDDSGEDSGDDRIDDMRPLLQIAGPMPSSPELPLSDVEEESGDDRPGTLLSPSGPLLSDIEEESGDDD